MTYTLGANSLAKLKGVDPRLIAVVKRAIEITRQDFTITCGVRTLAEQKRLYAQGRTAPGAIVTWTLNSRHLPAKDGLGKAVDASPYPIDWSNTPANLSRFDTVAKAMFQAAEELKIPIRWGADWDRDGKPREKGEGDSPHFELV